jgi:hypothetical protein
MAPGSVWASAVRQDQVRQLVQFVQEGAPRRDPVIVCGDFNAGPDSDEIRMLTGRAATAAPGKVFYDSWGDSRGQLGGLHLVQPNPLAAIGLYPDRRSARVRRQRQYCLPTARTNGVRRCLGLTLR